MAGWNHDNARWKPKLCAYCRAEFTPKSGVHKFCSTECKCKHRREHGCYRTEVQYGLISGDWNKYFLRLCAGKSRKGIITREDCMAILERQDGKCALSGETLTCVLHKGVITPTNASLDRIDAGGTYDPSNVQLVCSVLNKWRGGTPIAEYVDWCRKVVDYASKS